MQEVAGSEAGGSLASSPCCSGFSWEKITCGFGGNERNLSPRNDLGYIISCWKRSFGKVNIADVIGSNFFKHAALCNENNGGLLLPGC